MAKTLQANQIADAIITAPGVSIEIRDPQPASDLGWTATYAQFLPTAGGSITFTAPFAAEYLVTFLPANFTSTSSATTGRFKLVIDEGEASAQTLGDDTHWQQWVSFYEFSTPTFYTKVNLTAGEHTIKGYVKEQSGAGALRQWGNDAAHEGTDTVIQLQAITGSGAGGILVEEASLSADSATISSVTPADVTGLSITLDTADETVLLLLRGRSKQLTTGTQEVTFVVDGTTILTNTEGINGIGVTTDGTNWRGNISSSQFVALNAGQHTIKVQAAIATAGSFLLNEGTILQVIRFRGGLVPVSKDGVLVQDKPRAINYVGPNITATDVDGQVNVEVTSDNAPVFARDASDTSLISATAPVGASSTMRVALSDGVQRTATLPLTCDIDTDGIGGRDTGDATAEAAGDLYHLHAVPSDVDSAQIKLVLSKDAVPGTSGPPSFATYRYLWTVRIDTIGPVVIEPFSMTEDGWYEPLIKDDVDYSLDAADASTPGTIGSWVDKTTALQALIPESADAVEIHGFHSSTSQRVYIAAEATPSWTPAFGQPRTQLFLQSTTDAEYAENSRRLACPGREFAIWFGVSNITIWTIQLASYRNAMYARLK